MRFFRFLDGNKFWNRRKLKYEAEFKKNKGGKKRKKKLSEFHRRSQRSYALHFKMKPCFLRKKYFFMREIFFCFCVEQKKRKKKKDRSIIFRDWIFFLQYFNSITAFFLLEFSKGFSILFHQKFFSFFHLFVVLKFKFRFTSKQKKTEKKEHCKFHFYIFFGNFIRFCQKEIM